MRPRSVGKSVCLLTKETQILNALLGVAYRNSLPKSRPQLYRSCTEDYSVPRPQLKWQSPEVEKGAATQFLR